MPITHVTIPVPPAQVGETEWAEAHTLPTAGEVGALTTASAEALFLTPGSASAIYLLRQDASTTYARQTSAVTTAQLATELGSYLLSQDASTTYARQASAVTTAQLAVYLLSQDASTTYARQASAVTTAQLAVYLLSQDASTTYARQVSAVTTAQLGVYLLAQDASTTYARQASAVTTANANATYAVLAHSHSAGAITAEVLDPARLGSAGASIGVFLRGDGQWATVSVVVTTLNITEASADAKYITAISANNAYGVVYMVANDTTSNSNSTITTIPDLIVSCSASTAYRLDGAFVYRSSATSTGIGILCSVTPTPGVFMFMADIYAIATDGAAAVHCGYASANGDLIISGTCNAVADLPLTFQGTIVTGEAGQIQIGFRSEVSGAATLIRRGSSMRVTRLGAV